MDTDIYRCPHENCGLSSIDVSLRTAFHEQYGDKPGRNIFRRFVKGWKLVPPPKPVIKQWPESVPKVVVNDFTEASLIVELSPKAAAALARRCLQTIIRLRYDISEKTLWQEIQKLKGKVDELTWSAIDALREIGNIGAHPEKDPTIIIDISYEDASMLLELVERLMEDWYVNRYAKEALPKAIVDLAAEIKRLKEGH